MYYSDGIFTSAYKELREGIAAKNGVMAKKGAAPAKKEDPKAKGGEEKGANTSDEERVKQALYDIRYRAKREGVPVGQAMTDYLKHSASLGPKARAELKKKLMGEEVEQIDEISSALALTASQKADEVRRKASLAGDKDTAAAKAAQASRIYKGVAARKARERNVTKEEVENVEELYKGKHGQSEKEYQDGRSDGGKMVSGDSKRSGAAYSSRATKNTGPNPAGGSKRPQGQGRMTSGARADLKYRKANLMKKEEVEIEEGLKNARANVGAGKCWDGYKATGTKKKNGKEVPDCKKEETEQNLQRQQLQINRKKLQLQTKATQKKQKTDMSMREEVTTEELINLYNILENETLSYMHEMASSRVEEILAEESSTQKKGRGGETLYKVRVVNNDGRSEVRYASRSKISELRSNSNIKSVEITGYGDAYNEKPKEKKAAKDYDGDGKVESGSDEHAGAVHNAIQRKKGGKPDGQDTRKDTKEEVELDENRAAARSAGASKDDSKKQPDPSKAGFTGIGNMSIDQIRKMSARIGKEKSAKK